MKFFKHIQGSIVNAGHMPKVPPALHAAADLYYNSDDVCVFFEDFEITDQMISTAIAQIGTPVFIANTFYAKIDSAYSIQCMPLSLYSSSRPVVLSTQFDQTDQLTTSYCSNFILNRKRINRFILIKLVEWFRLTSIDYTYSSADKNYDMNYIIDEMKSVSSPAWPKNFESFILAPTVLPKKWIAVEGDVLKEKTQIKPSSNKKVWQAGLDKLFYHSAVSLITESIDYQAGAGYTEKTGFALLGKTFPIWVGGKYQAEEFSKLGYDIFDDVIDHSYQNKDTLIERCYHAVADNIDILTDLEFARHTRELMKQRLVNNQSLFINDCSSLQIIESKVMSYVKEGPYKKLLAERFRLVAL
jgi:hypothetical protein